MAALACAAALAVPATAAQAAETEEPGELEQALECLWHWVAEILPVPGGLASNCDHGSYIDPDG